MSCLFTITIATELTKLDAHFSASAADSPVEDAAMDMTIDFRSRFASTFARAFAIDARVED
jgi:hypothetical protein